MSPVDAALSVAVLTIPASQAFTSGRFEPNCKSEQDYGWPRYRNRTELEQDLPWATYFRAVYGDLPKIYPVCVYDMWDINALSASGALTDTNEGSIARRRCRAARQRHARQMSGKRALKGGSNKVPSCRTDGRYNVR